MSALVLRLWSIVHLAARRLLSERGLASATALGLVAAVALTMSIPLYADAVYFRLLRETILGGRAATPGTPLAFRFRYVGARDGALQWEDLQLLETCLNGPAAATLGLRQQALTHHFKTDIFRVYFSDSDPTTSEGLTWISFATVNDLEQHVRLVAGNLPAVAAPAPDSAVEVLVHEQTAAEFAWMVGDTYLVRRGDAQMRIRIAGIWTPADPLAKFWSVPLTELALVPEQVFADRISPALKDEIYLGLWQLIVDGGDLHAGDIASLRGRIDALQRQASAHLPNVTLDDSPLEALIAYQQGAPELTFLLLAFSIPLVGLLLAFIGLVVGLYVAQQQNQIAILRSRGATKAQVVGIAALEGAILGAAALLVGAPTGLGIAWLIGKARSFLNFAAPSNLRVGLTREAAGVGIAAIVLALAAQLAPTVSAARHTIVTYKQERARLLRPPWWQRVWLDGLLLLPTAYGFYVLQKQGSLAAEGGKAVHDVFRDPLLFLTPALGLFALALFIVRVLPLVMALVAWVSARTRSVGLLLAARQLSRAPKVFTAPLVLLILTLSLSAFTASLAQTLDSHLSKQVYYQAGADLNISETGITAETTAGAGGPTWTFNPDISTPEDVERVEGPRWILRPAEVHLGVQGVQAASRVGRYEAVVDIAPTAVAGVFIGVDRLTFPQVACWQRDFAPDALGALMNALALAPEGVLVTRDFLASHGLRVGDMVSVIVKAYDDSTTVSMKIVGAIDLFPTWYPEEGPLFVGNLGYFYEQAGYQFPYDVWLKTRADADHRRIVATVRGMTAFLDPNVDPGQVVKDGLNIVVTDWQSAPLDVLAEQRRPQRQGLFGLLSVGFIASALLTVLGFLLYALASFRRRFVELGVLRAVGLSRSQMIVLLACELAALIAVGMATGTALGVWVSARFIPYLQVGVEAASRFPPFVVVIAWPSIVRIYLLFGALFVAVLGGLTALLLRMKVFQAVKLGETV